MVLKIFIDDFLTEKVNISRKYNVFVHDKSSWLSKHIKGNDKTGKVYN